MVIKASQKNRFRNNCITIMFVLLTVYFIYHAMSGERGVINFIKLSHQVSKMQNDVEQIRAERLHVEHRVNLLRSDSLDLDLLDEQVRKLLGYANPQETIYITNDKNNADKK